MALDRVRRADVAAIFFLTAAAARDLGDLPARSGLKHAGDAPLMAFTGALPGQRPGYQVVEADAETLPAVADMISAAFGLDRADVARTFASPPMLASPGTGIYVARGRGRCVSTATVSRGALTGIWSMATPPDMQGQGAGRAALVGAMAAERARGAQAFYLIATPAGRPLYDSAGFVTVEEFPIHLSGESARF